MGCGAAHPGERPSTHLPIPAARKTPIFTRRDNMHRAVPKIEGWIIRADLILFDTLLSKSSLESGIDGA